MHLCVRRRQVLTGAIGQPSRPRRRLAGMFDETQSRRLKPAEDRPGHFAIRKGVRCAGVHLIIEPRGRGAAGRHRLHRRCAAARKLRAQRCCTCIFSIASEWRIGRLCHQILDSGGAGCGLRAAALHRRDRSKGKGVRHATARPRDRPDLTRLLPNLPIALGKRGQCQSRRCSY